MPRRQNTNRKIMSKEKSTAKAFKAPSPSPCSVWSCFPLGEEAGMRMHACAHTHRLLRGTLHTVPAPSSIPGLGYRHTAFSRSPAADLRG